MLPSYAELHCLTNFTFLRGASHPEELVERAVKLGYSALAVTDECSLAGVVRAHVAAKEAELKLIVGAEITLGPPHPSPLPQGEREPKTSPPSEGGVARSDGVVRADSHRSAHFVGTPPQQAGGEFCNPSDVPHSGVFSLGPRPSALSSSPSTQHPALSTAFTSPIRLVLLATNREGYGNLSELITRGRRQAKKGAYRLTRAELEHGLPGCLALLLPGAKPSLDDACWLSERFPGKAWIAAELLHGPDDRAYLEQLRHLSESSGLPLIAAGDVHMHMRERRALQDTLTAIRLQRPVKQCGRALFPNGERHLRSREDLKNIYPPELLSETLSVAERCTFSLESLRYEYPEEIVPAGETPASWLRKLAEDGFRWRFGHELKSSAEGPLTPALSPPWERVGVRGPSALVSGWGGHFTAGRAVDIDKARALVEHELVLIAELAYEPYFLTVYDIVRFARSKAILCQGRGSAANSALCYCLGITEVDPARMEMLFERFISKERNEPPDIDVDFEHERREEVIQYIYEKYGRERAALAATVISYRPKSALRDVGKALGLDLAQVDRLTKGLAWWDGRRVRPERLREAGFDPDGRVIQQLIALVDIIVGFPRHLSQHVGGFVISRGSLSRLVPIENAAMEDRTVIQWDKDDLDTLRLLKVDVLALGMLTAIRRALDLVSSSRGAPFTMADVPPEDPGVYEMIGHADTVGVFQIESRAQQAMLPRMRPACVYDLVIEVAIVRPGPIQGGMVHPYLRRRQGLEAISYPSEKVKQVLERTLGVPIFQEQVMQLAVVAAGFTPGEADRLRRAMAAWKRRGGLEPFEKKLKDGMQKNGYQPEFADQIYRQILGFGEYGFPESHSASFALLVYVSSWLKRYEPAAFTCALLNSQPMGFYAPAQLVQDAQRHGVEIRPVDVLVSEWECTLEDPLTPALSHGGEREFKTSPPSEGGVARSDGVVVRADSNHPAHFVGTPIPLLTKEGWRERDGVVRADSHHPAHFVGTPPQAGGEILSPLSPPRERAGVRGPAIRLGLRMVKGFSEEAAKRLAEARKRLSEKNQGRGPRTEGRVNHPGCTAATPPWEGGEFCSPSTDVPLSLGSDLSHSVLSTQHSAPVLLGPRPSALGSDFHAQHPALSTEALAHTAQLNRRDMNALAAAGALASIAGHRREAAWEVTGVEPRPPVLQGAPIHETFPALTAPSEGEDLVADYASLGLTLGRHPMALLRRRLDAMRMLTAAHLRQLPHGKLARAAGIVIGRQRPDTASGVIFVTLEDETGTINVVVWHGVAERQRRALLGSQLLAVHGVVEREGEVVHLVAGKLVDHSALLGRLVARSRDFH